MDKLPMVGAMLANDEAGARTQADAMAMECLPKPDLSRPPDADRRGSARNDGEVLKIFNIVGEESAPTRHGAQIVAAGTHGELT